MSDGKDFGVAHPDRATLEAFAAGRLEDEQFSSVEAHLEACEDCGRLVDAFSLRQDPLGAKIADLVPSATEDTTSLAKVGTAPTDVRPVNAASSEEDTLPANGPRARRSSVQAEGEPFGNYVLLSEVARGGMGVVYKAQQLKLNRLVALKMIKSGQLADDDDIKRFYTEAEAAAQLNHPGIVPIYEVGQHEDRHFFSMAFVEGESLENRISGTPLPARDAAELMQAIAEAIAYAHSQGVIHRDLKPANVLLDGQGRPKVADFGLAKNLQADSGLTHTGMIMGTPSYMSPEQAKGQPDAIGPLSDVYALGAILYCMLTGHPPFKAATPMETVRLVIEQEPVAPRQLNPKTPQDLETICLKCLAKEPNERYQSASEVAQELGRYLRGEPIVARPISRSARAWRWCKRNPVVAGLTAAVMLVLLVGITVSGYFAYTANIQANEARLAAVLAQQQRQLAQQQKKRADEAARLAAERALQEQRAQERAQQQQRLAEEAETRARDQQDLADAKVYANNIAQAKAAWDKGDWASANQYLASCGWSHRGWEYGFLYGLFNIHHRTLRGHSNGVTAVAYSPDARWVVSSGNDNTLVLWDAATGLEALVFTDRDVSVGSVAFSSGSKQIVSGSFNGTVTLWDMATGQKARTLNGHASTVTSVAFSPDGELLASASCDKTIALWHAVTGERVRTLAGHESDVTSVAFSPDGKLIASGSEDATIKLWNAQTGQEFRTLTGHAAAVNSVAFSPDGALMASGSADSTIKLWNAATGEEIRTLKGHAFFVYSVAFSPDSHMIASGSGDATVMLWNAATGEEVRTLKGHASSVTSVAFSPDGQCIASASGDSSIKLWELAAVDTISELRGHEAKVTCVAFSPNSQRIVSGSQDATVKLWDVATLQETRTFIGHSSDVTSVAFSPNGARIASASKDTTIKLWDPATGKEVCTLNGHADAVASVAFSPDGKLVASGSNDKTIKLWDAETGQEVRTLKEHRSFVTSVAFSPDGKQIASASADTTLKLWDVATGQELRTSKRHGGRVETIAFSPNGTQCVSIASYLGAALWDAVTGEAIHTLTGAYGATAASFSPDGQRLATGGSVIKVWNVKTGHELLKLNAQGRVASIAFSPDGGRLAAASGTFIQLWSSTAGSQSRIHRGHRSFVYSAAFSPDGKRIVSGSLDNTVRIWDAETGREILVITDAGVAINVAFSPDGRAIMSSDGFPPTRKVRIWDSTSGQEIRTLSGHGSVYCAVFSPDGSQIATGSEDATVTLWNVATGEEVRTLTGHRGGVNSIAFSPDGRQVVSGSGDKTIKLWDVTTGGAVRTISGHEGAVHSVAFSSDGRQIASGAEDSIIKLWDVMTGEEVCTLAGHRGGVYSIAFDPHGKRIASRSSDGSIKVWDAKCGSELYCVRVNNEYSDLRIAFSPSGRHIIGGVRTTVMLLDLEAEARDVASENDRILQQLRRNKTQCQSGTFVMDGITVAHAKGFWIGQTEVTQGQWKVVMGTQPWNGQGNVKNGTYFPAVYVSWEDAVAFCEKLTEMERKAGRITESEAYRLPTEAEWEHACRAGATSTYCFGDYEAQLSDYAWWGAYFGKGSAEGQPFAHLVATKRANAWGIYDMHGNVWEWCQDTSSGLPGAKGQVLRGGSWMHDALSCRSSNRYSNNRDFRNSDVGFRVVLAPVE